MIFSFLLCIKLKQMEGDADQNEFKFLLTGGVSIGEEIPPKPADWISDNGWAELNRACKLDGFKGYLDQFTANVDVYKELSDMPNP